MPAHHGLPSLPHRDGSSRHAFTTFLAAPASHFGVVVGDNGFRVAAYDVLGDTGGGVAGASAQTARRADGLTHDEPFFLLLNGDSAEEISVLWDKLSHGATVIASLVTSQSAAPPYGMLTDRFGITWILGVTLAH
jgi:PhnB protein